MLPDAELIRSFVKLSGRRELVPSLVRHAMPPLQEIPNDWECTAFVDNRTDLDTAVLPQPNRLAKRICCFGFRAVELTSEGAWVRPRVHRA